MHELITSDLCDIDFDLSLSRGRSKNNRRKDKSCNNGRAAHDHAPFRGRAKPSLPDRALIIDASLKRYHVQPAFSRVVVLIHVRGLLRFTVYEKQEDKNAQVV